MDHYSHNAHHQKYPRSTFDSESPRVQNRTPYDIGAAITAPIPTVRYPPRSSSAGSVLEGGDGGGSFQFRVSSDGREMSSRDILEMKDVVRASFQKGRSRSSVDGREGGLRESPRFGGDFVNPGDGAAAPGSGNGGGGDRLWSSKDAPRYSVDSGRGNHQTRALIDSPRLSTRIKEAVRAAVEGRLDSVRASFDSKDSLRSSMSATSAAAAASSMITSDRPRETPTPRSSSSDSRLLVELRESPRLSRDAPRYSWDGRDGPRSTPASAAVAPRLREFPRLSVDGRGGHFVPTSCHSVDEGELPSPYIPRDHHLSREPSYYHNSRRFDIDMKDAQQRQQQYGGEPRKRVPSLVARLMGLEDLPGDVKQTLSLPPLQIATTAVQPCINASAAAMPPQVTSASEKKPSKESKLLKGLLQYKPRTDVARPGNKSRAGEGPRIYDSQERLKDVFTYRQREQAEKGAIPAVAASVDVHNHQQPSPSMWNGRREAAPKPIKLYPKQLGLEIMPGALKQQEDVREMGALRQKVVEAMPKQLTEAVLTILKNADDNKKMPMSYADMENRLRQLRLRSSLQEHKTLRQILEAMQSKGLLNGGGTSRSKEGLSTPDARCHQQQDARQQKDLTYQNQPPLQIMLPKPQEHNPDAAKMRTLRDLKRLGSKLHDQALSSAAEDTAKPLRPEPQPQPQPQHQAQTQSQSTANQVASRSLRNPDDQQQQSASGASIVVMKPIMKPAAKKTSKTRNRALLVDSMPSSRSFQGGSGGGRASSWGSPLNRPRQQQQRQPGFGFGRESKGRINTDAAAAAVAVVAHKLRRERILTRAQAPEGQLEHSVARSPKLIALPQSTTKVSFSSVAANDFTESWRPLRLNLSVENRNGEKGKRTVRSSASMRGESNKTASGKTSRSQHNRDLAGAKKLAASSIDAEKLRRSNSEGRSSGFERDRIPKSTGPAEVVILRNRSKRVSLTDPDSKAFAPGGINGNRRAVSNGGFKPAPGIGEKVKDRTSAPIAAPSPERRASKDNAAVEQQNARKNVKQGGADDLQDHVRVIDGEALDHTNGRTPLVGLTNRLQNTEVALGERDRDCQGQRGRSPRNGILEKKDFSNSEEELVVAERIDVSSELPQPSPVSVLDPASLYEEDVSPLALNKAVRGMRDNDHCEDSGNDIDIVQPADAQFQGWSHGFQLGKDPKLVGDEASQHLMFLRESAKILPPQGKAKSIILPNQAEKVYVRDVLVVSGATMGIKAIHAGAAAGVIDPAVFDYLEEKQVSSKYGPEQKAEETSQSEEKWDGEKERQLWDRRMLFDCLNEALSKFLVPYVHSEPWIRGLHAQPLRRKPTGQALVQQLWNELSSLPPQKPCGDICESLYSVLQKDLVQHRNSWTDFTDEVEGIGMEVEKMIFKDLVEETLLDVAQECGLAR